MSSNIRNREHHHRGLKNYVPILLLLSVVVSIMVYILFFNLSLPPGQAPTYTYTTDTIIVGNESTITENNETISASWLVYVKMGGVKGVNNILNISKPAYATYTCIFAPRFGNKTFILSTNESEVEDIFKRIITEYRILKYDDEEYKPRNVYDYFTYQVIIKLENNEEIIRVRWVDEWASETPIPNDLTKIKTLLDGFIRKKTIECI